MATKNPYINPIRIRPTSINIDYVDVFPRFDLITQRINYQRGVDSVSVYPDALINKEIQLEVFDDTNVTFAILVNLETNNTINCVITDISPSGWASTKPFRIRVTPIEPGVHEINIVAVGGNFKTDEFLVKDGATNKDLIKFEYSDTENRLEYGGGVYYDGITQNWNPVAYFTGIKRKIVAPTEVTKYTDEPGNETTLQSTGSKAEQVTLTDIHETYIDVIEEIVKVDTLYMNGQLVSISELSADPIEERADVVNITFVATRADNDGYMNYD